MTYIIMSILVGAIVGSVSAYISSAIIRFTSSRIGGSASYAETIVAYSLGAIPVLATYIVSLILLLVFIIAGDITSYNSVAELATSPFVKVAGWSNMLGSVICVIITPILIARTNRFSVIKGIISYLSMIVIPGVIIGGIVLVTML